MGCSGKPLKVMASFGLLSNFLNALYNLKYEHTYEYTMLRNLCFVKVDYIFCIIKTFFIFNIYPVILVIYFVYLLPEAEDGQYICSKINPFKTALFSIIFYTAVIHFKAL